jgi:hypothetical protein
LDAVKTEYPHLIECPAESQRDDDGPDVPNTPQSVDKENFVMTQILPHIFVGMYSPLPLLLLQFLSTTFA